HVQLGVPLAPAARPDPRRRAAALQRHARARGAAHRRRGRAPAGARRPAAQRQQHRRRYPGADRARRAPRRRPAREEEPLTGDRVAPAPRLRPPRDRHALAPRRGRLRPAAAHARAARVVAATARGARPRPAGAGRAARAAARHRLRRFGHPAAGGAGRLRPPRHRGRAPRARVQPDMRSLTALIDPGSARARIGPAAAGELVTAAFEGPEPAEARVTGDSEPTLTLRQGRTRGPQLRRLAWDVALTAELPLDLTLRTGSGGAETDLT